MSHAITYTLLIILGLAGFYLSFYLNRKKRSKTPMTCPLKANCSTVIFSDYSKFFGISVEILGMLYYIIIALGYGMFLLFSKTINPSIAFFLYSLTITAFLFSAYLIFIQAFAIKNWCTWCIISAGICTAIFGVAIFGASFGFSELLVLHKNLLVILHLIGMSLGLGAVTMTDVFFFKFLKDFRISEFESEVLKIVSDFIWFALALAIISGIGLYLPQAEILNNSPRFLLKIIVVGVIIINGAILNLIISPKLIHITFGEAHGHESGELSHLRKLAFALGAISITSWYSAFMLGAFRSFPFDFTTLLSAYLTLIFIAISGSQIMDILFRRRLP